MSELPPTQRSSEATECVSQAVVEAIADHEGTNPSELQPTLHSVINPEALDSLVHSMSTHGSCSQGQIGFFYCGYEVSINSEGEIAVTKA